MAFITIFNFQSGGGEDIDFCRMKRLYALEHGGEGFRAAPNVVVTHPWWDDGSDHTGASTCGPWVTAR